MDLDERLKRVATGIDVGDAIEAYMRALSGDAAPAREDPRARELDAVIELMFLMAAVDGDVADLELKELRAGVRQLPGLDALGGDLDARLVEHAEALARDGWKARLDAAGARVTGPELKRFAFRLAAGVAFVDDFVANAEAAALDALAQALGLTPSESQAILRDVHAALFGA